MTLKQSGVMELMPPKHQGSLPRNMWHRGKRRDWIISKVYDSVPVTAALISTQNLCKAKTKFATCNLDSKTAVISIATFEAP